MRQGTGDVAGGVEVRIQPEWLLVILRAALMDETLAVPRPEFAVGAPRAGFRGVSSFHQLDPQSDPFRQVADALLDLPVEPVDLHSGEEVAPTGHTLIFKQADFMNGNGIPPSFEKEQINVL